MRQCMDADNLHRRLKKIIGQVQAIDRMVDEDIPCEDVLAQINAAKSALHKVGQVVLEGHINHCVRDGIEHGDADKTDQELHKGRRALCKHDLKHITKDRTPDLNEPNFDYGKVGLVQKRQWSRWDCGSIGVFVCKSNPDIQ